MFVPTHHAREPLTTEGGTSYTFVSDGIERALAQARHAAGGTDVALATRFMELHRMHWPDFEGEPERRPLEDMGDPPRP